MRDLAAIESIQDPFERAAVASDELQRLDVQADKVRTIRDLAFNELYHTHGISLRAIAARYGVSKSLVADVTR